MDWQKEAERSVIRGLGYRVTRGLPWWVAALLLGGVWIFGALAK